MSQVGEKFLSSIFVIVVIVGIISGSVVFFKPSVDFSAEGSPSAFAVSTPISPTSTAQKTPFATKLSQQTVSAGPDKTAVLNSNVVLEAVVPSNVRVTYFTWKIVSPSGKVENKFGRKVTFQAKETGKYIATLTYSRAPLKTSKVTVTVLPATKKPVVKPTLVQPTLAKPVLTR